jgi:hypothetical protein
VIAALPAERPVRSVTGMENIDITPHRDARLSPVRALGLGIAGLLAAYLVGRGIAEFFTVHYNDPASYANSWGGPSLAGVFAVHTGPAVAIVAASVVYLIRHRRAGARVS